MAVASLANRIQVNTNCGNNDALYGPYNSIDEALTLIPSALINGKGAIGRTIGVIESGKVVEYWWQPVGDGIKFIVNRSEIECERNHEQDRGGYIAWESYGKSDLTEYFYTKEDSPEVFMYRQVIGDFPITADSYETIIIYGFVKKVVADSILNNSSFNPIANKAVADEINKLKQLLYAAL